MVRPRQIVSKLTSITPITPISPKNQFINSRKKTFSTLSSKKNYFTPSTPPNFALFSKKHIEYESKLTRDS